MADRSKQIIPNLEAVARCLDPEILEILDLHSTFVLSDFLEMFEGYTVDCTDTIDGAKFIETLTSIIAGIIQQGYSREYLVSKVSNFVKGSILDPDRNNQKIMNALLSGINCNLLQPDGKGWEKGKLKICFEFIPEESELIAAQSNLVEPNLSPLDEIRQLANELTAMTSLAEPPIKKIEQN
jgi:KGK domain